MPGFPTNPSSWNPSFETEIIASESASPFPNISLTRSKKSSQAGERKRVRPFSRRENSILLWAKAYSFEICIICADSVTSVLRNFLLPGTELKRCETSILVPTGIPQSLTWIIFPPFKKISHPSVIDFERVRITNRHTLDIDGNASPLNPKVFTSFRSLAFRILLVACLSKLISAWSGFIPSPLSSTRK